MGHWTDADLLRARGFSKKNRVDVELSDACGCFACGNVFPPRDVGHWVAGDETAICPKCFARSVLPRKSCPTAADREFLSVMKAKFVPTPLHLNHQLSIWNRRDIEASQMAGCFQCLKAFPANEVVDWCDQDGTTALCPYCGIDSVMPDAVITDAANPDLLLKMHEFWFGRTDE